MTTGMTTGRDMRTYLYVDGENFAIRAGSLQAELRANAEEYAKLREQLRIATDWWAPDHLSHEGWGSSLWSPEPQRSMYRALQKNALLYTPNEVYWDGVGLFIAFTMGMAGADNYRRSQIPIDKAFYFAASRGDRVKQHERDLHGMGFAPHVLPKIKPDSWAKEMKALGITVISRPKPIDIMLATQVLDDCTSNNFDRCIFVGGDVDYVPLLEAVRRRGKQVWLVAFERWLDKASSLRLACDRFFAYDTVLAARPLPEDASVPEQEA